MLEHKEKKCVTVQRVVLIFLLLVINTLHLLDKCCLLFVNTCKHGVLYDRTYRDYMSVISTGGSPTSINMGVWKVCVIHSQFDEILIRLIILLSLFWHFNKTSLYNWAKLKYISRHEIQTILIHLAKYQADHNSLKLLITFLYRQCTLITVSVWISGKNSKVRDC